MGRYEASATVDWQGFGGSVESGSGMLVDRHRRAGRAGRPGRRDEPRGAVRGGARQLLHVDDHEHGALARDRPRARRHRGARAARVERRRRRSPPRGERSRRAAVVAGRTRASCSALVDDATEHCPVCQAIRGNVAMQRHGRVRRPVSARRARRRARGPDRCARSRTSRACRSSCTRTRSPRRSASRCCGCSAARSCSSCCCP